MMLMPFLDHQIAAKLGSKDAQILICALKSAHGMLLDNKHMLLQNRRHFNDDGDVPYPTRLGTQDLIDKLLAMMHKEYPCMGDETLRRRWHIEAIDVFIWFIRGATRKQAR